MQRTKLSNAKGPQVLYSRPNRFSHASHSACQLASGSHSHLASATRIRQPPENVLVARRCMSASKDSPARMRAALASAAYASISSRRLCTWRHEDRLKAG